MEYLSRDISWLSFNKRVLDEFHKPLPLSERLCFIGIASSNLDEFLRTRYASSFEKKDIINDIKYMHDNIQYKIDKLNDIDLFDYIDPNWSKEAFDNIYPILTPVQVDDIFSPKQGTMYIFIESSNGKVVIQIPDSLPRFYRSNNGKIYLIENIILHNIGSLLRDVKIIKKAIFRVLRNAEFILQGDNVEQYDIIEQMVKDREKSWLTTLEISNLSDKNAIDDIINMQHLNENTIILESKMVKGSDLKDINDYLDKDDQRRDFKPRIPKGFNKRESIFDIIKKKDRLVYHPFESFKDSFVRFISEAAEDPDVLSIKITLYRVGEKSDIINALLKAADNGKNVTALVELKARFDEKNNLKMSKILVESGVSIVYGSMNIKTHAKVCMVTRSEGDSIRIYSHIGTGNYNEANSKIYTDYSYFTASKDLGNDLTSFFNLLTSKQKPFDSKEIIYAPYNMRKSISSLIDDETHKGKDGRIIIKCNSLTDDKICDKLYTAAKAGVSIILIIRGACIIPRELFGNNVKIYSVIGRFLEHSRVYIFGKRKDKKILIGSSDIMHRNLNNRNELLLLVKNSSLKERIFSDIKLYLRDNTNRYQNTRGYDYKRITGGLPFDSHSAFMK